MSQLLQNFNDLAPELVIQIAKNLTTLSAFNILRKSNPYFHRVVQAYEFEICECIADKEFSPRLRPYVHQLLAAQGSLQRSLGHASQTPEPSLPTAKTTGILSGGMRVGMAEAAQLESYIACLETWKPVYLADIKAHPGSVGGPFPGLAFRVNPFNLSDTELTPDIHFRIDRAFFQFWVIMFLRVNEEQQFSREMLARSRVDGSVDYLHWCMGHVKKLQECPPGMGHLYAMYEWIKVIPRICEPSEEAAVEMWDVIMVGGFDYDVQGGMGAEVIPVPKLKGIYGPPGTWRNGKVMASVERLRGLWVLDLHKSLWLGH